jgi:hypothetical protein
MSGVIGAGALLAAALLPAAPAHAQGALGPLEARPDDAHAGAGSDDDTPVVAVDAATSTEPTAQFGAAMRTRWITIPGWFLDLFTKANVPLSSYGVGLEVFRRSPDRDLDIAVGFIYQKMGPPDGNWLGRGKAASEDTDFVQFRNFGLVGADVSFNWRTPLNDYFGVHYGAGLGLALVTGEILRISAAGCTEGNVRDTAKCRPKPCVNGCTEKILKDTEGEPDAGPDFPSRFRENSVPGAIPIVNLTTGINFRMPEVQGFEARLEGGFYNAFFLGLSLGYVF